MSKSKKVLLADEVVFARKRLKDVLCKYGYDSSSFIETQNGKEAVELFHANAANIGFIIMGVVMPEMDGIRATKAIREINREIPVIIMGPYNEELIRESIQAGANNYLIKSNLAEGAVLRVVNETIGHLPASMF